MPAAAAPAAPAATEEEAPAVSFLTFDFSHFYKFSEQEKPKEKTSFNVKLESFDATAKAKVIREVKALVPNLTLIEVSNPFHSSKPKPKNLHLHQAKKFVESLPQILKENMPKEEAEKLKATLEGHGAVVKLE